MSDGDITIQFGILDGQYADATIASQALLAWIDYAKAAAHAIDPDCELQVALIGRERGSLRNLLKLLERKAKEADEGQLQDYPYLKKAAVGLAIGIATTVITDHATDVAVSVERGAVHAVEAISEEMKELRDKIANDRSARVAAQNFYRVIEQDKSITDLEVADDHTSPPVVVIPRAQFPERGGLFDPQEQDMAPAEENREAVWTVVLVKAAFISKSRSWTFSRDGVDFSAKMEDAEFLTAIHDGTLPISLQEGVNMRVRVVYRERLVGQVWEYIPQTRRVIKVLSPSPFKRDSNGSQQPEN